MATENQNTRKRKFADMAEDVRSIFTDLREKLDDTHARRERVVKASRDVTATSKKIIFALHRVQDMYADDVSERVHKATTSLWADVAKSLESVKEDLADGREWEFRHQISPGLQEAIEAYAFERFLVAKQVVGLDETRIRFQGQLVTESDYVLGLMDMTGEMMRYAIAHLVDPTHGGVSEITTEICALMRKVVGTVQQLAAGGRATGPSWRELPKKLEVAHNSLSKVEAAMLSCVVRVAESGKTPAPSGMAVG